MRAQQIPSNIRTGCKAQYDGAPGKIIWRARHDKMARQAPYRSAPSMIYILHILGRQPHMGANIFLLGGRGVEGGGQKNVTAETVFVPKKRNIKKCSQCKVMVRSGEIFHQKIERFLFWG